MKITKEDSILIIGGGIAGLTLALSLRKAGFLNMTIFEKESNSAIPQIPINLGTNVLRILEEFQMAEEGWAIGIPWEQMTIHTKNGKVFNDLDFSRLIVTKEHFPMTANFAQLHELLKKKLPKEMFVTGEEFISFTQTEKDVEAHFRSGLSVKGKLLIGADGFDSRVRLQMMGSSEKRTFHRAAYKGILNLADFASPDHQVFQKPIIQYYDQQASFTAAPVSADKIGVSFSIPYEESPKSIAEVKEILPGLYEGWAEPVAEAAKLAAKADLYVWEEKDRKPIKGWSQNRVILTGDAAHPCFPFMGIGMSLTMGSSMYLGKMLSEHEKKIERGLKQYEKVRSKVANEFNKFAERNASIFNWKQAIAGTFRNMVYQFLPNGYTESPVINLMNTDYSGTVLTQESLAVKPPESSEETT